MTEYENELIEQIKGYLKDTTYNYAVLLNGNWGIGKTYFVMNKLKPALCDEIDDIHLKYISLYGCKSREAVRTVILETIIGDYITKKVQITEKLTENTSGEKKKKREKLLSIGTSAFKRSVILWLSDKGVTEDIRNIVTDSIEGLVDLSIYFIIVDDLERALCSADEILGALNDIVEHENAKMLIIANEYEIGGYNKDDGLELKYLVAANDNIQINHETKEVSYITQPSASSNNIENIRQRVSDIFADDLLTNRYKLIREKLIGNVIDYRPDIVETMHAIITQNGGPDKLKDILNNQVGFYKEYMEHFGHQNFRTFQFFISKAKYLYNSCSRMAFDNVDKTILLETIMEQCFKAALKYKIGVDVSDRSDIQHNLEVRLVFIDKYVQTGWYISSSAKAELVEYIDSVLVDVLPEDDAYSLLNNECFWHNQKWAESKLQELLNNLCEDRYPVSQYGNILRLLAIFKEYGFGDKWFNDAYSQMEQNIRGGSQVSKIIAMPNYVVSDETNSKVVDAILSLNGILNNENTHKHHLDIHGILHSKNWLSQLKKYLKKDMSMATREPLFIRVEVSDWIGCLLSAEPGDIYEFERFIGDYYFYGIYREEEEVEYIEDIANGINHAISNNSVKDLIRVQNLKMLTFAMNNIAAANKKHFV